MVVIDKYGAEITIDDLQGAIAQIKEFMSYRNEDKSFQGLDKRLSEYGTDLYNKISKLRDSNLSDIK